MSFRNTARRFVDKKFSLFILVIAVAALSGCVSAELKLPQNDNLVKNAGFEEGAAHWSTLRSARVVDGAAHSGSHSLYYKNIDPKQYKLFTQEMSLQPNQHIQVGAWLKGENVGKDGFSGGASVFVESYDGSNFIGGKYLGSLTGTFDWKPITGDYIIPSNATRTLIGLYLRRGVTGAVWFDDIEVRVKDSVPFASYLLYPNYRGMIKQGENNPWKFQVEIRPQSNWKTDSITIFNTLTDDHGKVLLQKVIKATPDTKKIEITLDAPRNLANGNYTLKQSITDPNGKEAFTASHTIRVVEKMPKSYIDAQGFTVLNGKRFFPMGVYLGPTRDEDLARISAGGFNTILAYGYGNGKDPQAYMERAQKHNLKVVYSLKDMYPGKHGFGDEAFDVAEKYIKMLRDNPALLAWYTNDELDIEWLTKLQKTYDLVTQLDPDHPAFQVLDKTGGMEMYLGVTDILGSDPYPVGSKDLTLTSSNTLITAQAMHGANGVWMVPQLMDWAVYRPSNKSHQPSLDEMRNQAYQAIINGATGLIWYSYFDLMYEKHPRSESTKNMDLFHKRWKDTTMMAKEINEITPAILENRRLALNLPVKTEVQAGAWQDGDDLLILLANPYYEEKSITFELPEGWKIKDANQGQIKSTFANGKATFILPSVGSGVFELEKK